MLILLNLVTKIHKNFTIRRRAEFFFIEIFGVIIYFTLNTCVKRSSQRSFMDNPPFKTQRSLYPDLMASKRLSVSWPISELVTEKVSFHSKASRSLPLA